MPRPTSRSAHPSRYKSAAVSRTKRGRLALSRSLARLARAQTAKDLQADRDAHVVHVSTGCPEVRARLHTPRPRLPTKPHCSHSPLSLSLSLCSQLDAIFGGGVESGSITEFYGEYRTGKTQLCLTLCVSSFLPRALGGGEGKALFLDTEGTFRPERLAPIAARYELDEDFVMENVMHARVLNCDHLDELLRDAAGLLADEEAGPFRVLIIDSIIALYRQV